MKKRKTVSLNKQDIEHGIKGSCDACPIASAMSRTFGRAVRVFGDEWRFVGDKGLRYFSLPPKARKFIRDFDDANPVETFGFTAIYTA